MAAALDGLRAELETAWRQGAKSEVRLRAETLTLTFTARPAPAPAPEGSVDWYLSEPAGAAVTDGGPPARTVTVQLRPVFPTEARRSAPLRVSADEDQPGD
jgi:hypothetical protein